MDISTCIKKIFEYIKLVECGALPASKVTSAIADVIDEYKYGLSDKSPIEEVLGCDEEVIETYLENVGVEDFRKHISDLKAYRMVLISNN